MNEKKNLPAPPDWPRNLNDPNDALAEYADEPLLPGDGIYLDEQGHRIPKTKKKRSKKGST